MKSVYWRSFLFSESVEQDEKKNDSQNYLQRDLLLSFLLLSLHYLPLGVSRQSLVSLRGTTRPRILPVDDVLGSIKDRSSLYSSDHGLEG